MEHDYAGRLARAAAEVDARGLDAAVITPSADLVYLIGYDPPPLERLTALVIRPRADALLLVPQLERPRAASSPAGRVVEMRAWRDGDDPHDLLASVVGASTRTLAVSDSMPAAHLLPFQSRVASATLTLASTITSSLRICKEPPEVELLRRVGSCTDDAFGRILTEPFVGRSESDVAATLSAHLLDAGAESIAFMIVGSGPNGASPHHEPTERRIAEGDGVVLDFGGRVGGYCSDMTRTVVAGDPSSELREVHAVVKEAQEAAFRAVKPGVAAEDVDRAARDVIEAAGYGDAFIHRTGHGIGLDEHEPPYIVAGNREPLEAGMCFSIEPGIYLEARLGVRIEDIVVVTADGAERLNEAPRELLAVPHAPDAAARE